MRKLTAFTLVVVMAAAMTVTTLAVPISADTIVTPNTETTTTTKSVNIWNGSVNTSWYTGKKTSYNIGTASQLAGLSKLVNSGYSMQGVTINLTADITLNDTTNWKNWNVTPPKNKFTPIGNSGGSATGYTPFAGIFNGNGHTIKGLYVNSYRTAGLFGYLYCAGVSSVIIKESCIIGYDDGVTEQINNGVYAGGIAGVSEGSVINQCENNGIVYANAPEDIVAGYRSSYAGGIVGAVHVEKLFSTTAFSTGGMFANPVLFPDGNGGSVKTSGVTNCINNGAVYSSSSAEAYSGGITGWGNGGNIQNCFNLGGLYINGNRGYIGQIAGGASNCTLTNCYYSSEMGMPNGIGNITGSAEDTAEGKTAEQIKSRAFATGLGNAISYVKNDRPHLAVDLSI